MQIPWLTRLPTAEEVAAHARSRHGVRFAAERWGYWLKAKAEFGPELIALRCTADGHVCRETYDLGMNPKLNGNTHWLPCTAEGIPVCLADQKSPQEIIAEYFGKLERQRGDLSSPTSKPSRRLSFAASPRASAAC